jgi:hypothetical protein
MFRECTIRLIQPELGVAPDTRQSTERHVVVLLKKAWPLTAPEVAQDAMYWVNGGAMQEWQSQYVRTQDGRAGEPEADPNELWVGLYKVTFNNLNMNHNYDIGTPSSDPTKKIWRHILNYDREIRLSYFIRRTDKDHDTLVDPVILRGATMTKRGFLPPGGESGTGLGWIENGGSLFRHGLVYWRVN